MPGTELAIWFAMPRAMNPAPTMPTRIGLRSASRRFRAVSTMNIRQLQLRLEVGPARVFLRNDFHRNGPIDLQRRIVVPNAALGAGRVELANLVNSFSIGRKREISVREQFGH